MKYAVVTGASTGIGWGITKVLTVAGWHVFGSVRKQEDGARLSREFGTGQFTPLRFDVTDADAIKKAARKVSVALEGRKLDALVNNAGIAVSGPIGEIDVKEVRRQFEVNLIGPIQVSQAFLPLLGTERGRQGKPGRVVMISSVGGKMSFPFLGPYSASKHALEGLSEALRRELLLYGIDVIIVGPGSVATPIWDKAEKTELGHFAKSDYALILTNFQKLMVARGRSEGLAPEAVGRVVLKALTVRAPKTRYAIVPGSLSNWIIPRLLPTRLLDRMIGKALGLT